MMIDWSWISTTGVTLLMIFLSTVGIYLALLLYTRIAGLRSFSKMSTFDFAITVAFGSIVATTMLTEKPSLLSGAFGLAVLFGIQYTVSRSRRMSKWVTRAVDNEPLLLMAGDRILTEHMNEARVSEGDLKSKLREAGVTHPDQVLAAILETTGDVCVLKKSDQVSPWIFDGVRGVEHLPFMKG